MLVGLPACGKSVYADGLRAEGYDVVSSDAVREELFGSAAIQGDPNQVFGVVNRRVRAALLDGRRVVYDATNLSRRKRINFIHYILHGVTCRKRCVLFVVPIEECRRRNLHRSRRVPEDTYDRMLCGFHVPLLSEGWDGMDIRWYDQKFDVPFADRDFLRSFDQETHWHGKTLGEHMDAAERYAAEHGATDFVRYAAGIHDIGKVYTKRHENTRGEYSEDAHYYGHENYGAYLALLLGNWDMLNGNPSGFSEEQWLMIAQLVNWHMAPFTSWSQGAKARAKDEKLLGPSLYQDILMIHEADVHAH